MLVEFTVEKGKKCYFPYKVLSRLKRIINENDRKVIGKLENLQILIFLFYLIVKKVWADLLFFGIIGMK